MVAETKGNSGSCGCGGCVSVTQSVLMTRRLAAILTILVIPALFGQSKDSRKQAADAAAGQAENQLAPPPGTIARQEEDFQVYTDHPRLFLPSRRLKLLKRERERTSIRWQQFETLVAGRAPMTEPGFAWSLYYQISGREEFGKQAVQWALGNSAADLRQLAIVFDWCQELLSEGQSRLLADKLRRGMERSKGSSMTEVRSRVLAAVALGGHKPEDTQGILKATVEKWWRGEMVPAISQGKRVVEDEDLFAMFELMHAIRDNTNIDLRDDIPKYFKELPSYHLHAHYPATFPAAENEFRVPIYDGDGEPDIRAAVLSRAADFAMVAFDSNALENQFLQGWLIHDRFLMKGMLGIVYEFLWANPYQPGLSFYHVPLLHHDEVSGSLFVRNSWEEDATWFAYRNGKAQAFQNGARKELNLKGSGMIEIGSTTIRFGKDGDLFTVTQEGNETTFILGLKPKTAYDVEIDHEEMFEAQTDPGGTLRLPFPPSKDVGVRVHAAGIAPAE